MEIRGTRVARGFVQGRVRRPHAFAGIRIACPGSRACGVFGVSRPRGALPVGRRGSRARGPQMGPRRWRKSAQKYVRFVYVSL